jgi:hypothetical protein
VIVTLDPILGSDLGPDLASKLNAWATAIQASFGFDQTLSQDVVIPTNRTQVTYGEVTIGGTNTLTIQGTGIFFVS